MAVWVAVLKSGKKEKKEIIMISVLMMKYSLKRNNRISISPLKVPQNFY
jgi:hypothetical protein